MGHHTQFCNTGQERWQYSQFSSLRVVALLDSSWFHAAWLKDESTRLTPMQTGSNSPNCHMYGLHKKVLTFHCRRDLPPFHQFMGQPVSCGSHIPILRASKQRQHNIVPSAAASTTGLAATQLHDDGSLVQHCLLELLVGEHNGAIEEHLILQDAATHCKWFKWCTGRL